MDLTNTILFGVPWRGINEVITKPHSLIERASLHCARVLQNYRVEGCSLSISVPISAPISALASERWDSRWPMSMRAFVLEGHAVGVSMWILDLRGDTDEFRATTNSETPTRQMVSVR